MDSKTHKGNGHRSRLKKRFLDSGFEGFLDYEIIELLLTIGTPRRDCKDTAKLLISKYGTVNNILFAKDTEIKTVNGVGDSNVFGIKLGLALITLIKKEVALTGGLEINNMPAIIDYLQIKIGHNEEEVFVLMCCDSRGRLKDNIISVGSLNTSVVHPREVYKLAMSNNSDSIIIAHNHPSGDTSPSNDDIFTTRKLEEAGKIVGIKLIDHLIIAKGGSTSMRDSGYIAT